MSPRYGLETECVPDTAWRMDEAQIRPGGWMSSGYGLDAVGAPDKARRLNKPQI